ncbi:putative homeobox-leucine zipper protein HOX26 [Musa acuminata AAA Group]|uniref:putative homeobox-leucine zipper protein HOX26 n=1 Tax=Musa acuminata AAA Group TaxID=214697 RepID=UPI0031E2DCE7
MDPGEGNGEKRALDGEDLVSNKKLRKNRFHVRVLQDAFYGAQHPSAAKKAELADQTGLTLEQMQAWFAIRRAYDSCRRWQRKPSDENSIDDPMEGAIVLSLPAPMIKSRWLPVRPPQVIGR